MLEQDTQPLSGGTPQAGYTRIVVKFNDDVALPYVDGAEQFLPEAEKAAWDALARTYPGITLQRLYTATDGERIGALVMLAQERDATYNPPNLLSYFVILAPATADANTLMVQAKGIVNADTAAPLPDATPQDVPTTLQAGGEDAAPALGMGGSGVAPDAQTPPANFDQEGLVSGLSKLPSVQNAYVELDSGDPSAGTLIVAPALASQGYLDQAPGGINARFAWQHGGDGSGMRLIDMEQGWTLDHEALASHQIRLTYGQIVDVARVHGTEVLGIICATENPEGVLGIAQKADPIRVISYRSNIGLHTNGTQDYTNMLTNRPDAILAAIVELIFDGLGSLLTGRIGDVLLLEVQLIDKILIPNGMAIEYLDAEFDTIRLATALGIVVVEAAGNNGSDLDSLPHLSRAGGMANGFRDSGAIMVGAASAVSDSDVGWSGWRPWVNTYKPAQRTNYGSRVDCYAWGENIATSCSRTLLDSGANNPCDTSNTSLSDNYTVNDYSFSFSGTSGASAIIAGAALALQSGAQANLGRHYRPDELRAIISNAANGTKSQNWPNDGIGVMPDLQAIFVNALKISQP